MAGGARALARSRVGGPGLAVPTLDTQVLVAGRAMRYGLGVNFAPPKIRAGICAFGIKGHFVTFLAACGSQQVHARVILSCIVMPPQSLQKRI